MYSIADSNAGGTGYNNRKQSIENSSLDLKRK